MLILDGRKDSEFGLKALIEHENPLNAEVTHKTLKVPGRDGLYYFGSERNEKPFVITFDIIDDSPTLRQYKLNDFVAFLHDKYGEPRPIKAIFDYEPDKYYMIMINGRVTPTMMNGLSQFVIPFVAYDPNKYSVAYSDEITWGSEEITFLSHYLLGHPGSDRVKTITAPTTLNVYTDGMANKPVIEITGSATDLTLSANGYTINLATFVNTSWAINCENYTVIKDGISTFLTNLRDFVLLPGNNQVTVSGSGLNCTIRIKVRDKYI